ncbi:MAG: ABC transporter permease, partial [Oscillospiraceae bacterium]|nr:ABC transporter permease [Oscillospiraceae bacterium]
EFVAENFGAAMFGSQENADTAMQASGANPMASMMRQGSDLWCELLPGKNGEPVNQVLEGQYDLIYGHWPKEYNELVLVVDKNNEIGDLALYALGLTEKSEMDKIFDAVLDGKELENAKSAFDFETLCDKEYRVVLSSDCFTYEEVSDTYTDLRGTDAGLRYLYDNAETVKIAGIIRPNEDAAANMLTGSIGYTYKLTEHVIEKSKESDALKAQEKDPETDIFTGLPFKENTGNLTDSEKETEFKKYIEGLNKNQKADAYVQIMSIPSQETLDKATDNALKNAKRADIEKIMTDALTQQMGMDKAQVEKYVTGMEDDEVFDLYKQMVAEQVKAQTAMQVKAQLGRMQPAALANMLDDAIEDYTTAECAQYYDEVLKFSDATYEGNLYKLGGVDIDDPSVINLYASSFENKDVIEDMIAQYNEGVDELQQIGYVDYVGLMMSSITTIINAITYVLISFVAISLVVSSIMIGVITLISVQERTKEIGVLRAIGASKRNVSNMFNAETVIIGFAAGALGIGVTYLLCIPINAIIRALTGIPNLKAMLPFEVAVILILLSMVLTMFAGIIPSRSAAKKDPVVALRSE